MKTLVPEYFPEFRCIASDCINNCCRAGWEIDLDDETAAKYRNRRDDRNDILSKEFSESVFFPTVKQRRDGARPMIRMNSDGSCPFLNSSGLCRLILEGGEKNICQICRDHPRFRNFYPDRIEMGIGMCCEEALRLILCTEKPGYFFLNSKEPAEPAFVRMHGRQRVHEAMTGERKYAELIGGLGKLEQLEPEWGRILAQYLTQTCESSRELPEKEMNCLEEYLLYRHFSESGPEFIAFSMVLIRELFLHTEYTFNEICRLFSTEIEYSEENRLAMIKMIS